jgi:hypothetical protein
MHPTLLVVNWSFFNHHHQCSVSHQSVYKNCHSNSNECCRKMRLNSQLLYMLFTNRWTCCCTCINHRETTTVLPKENHYQPHERLCECDDGSGASIVVHPAFLVLVTATTSSVRTERSRNISERCAVHCTSAGIPYIVLSWVVHTHSVLLRHK